MFGILGSVCWIRFVLRVDAPRERLNCSVLQFSTSPLHSTGAEMSNSSKKCSFYIAQYPVSWTAQRALHFLPSLADMFIPTPTQLLREAF